LVFCTVVGQSNLSAMLNQIAAEGGSLAAGSDDDNMFSTKVLHNYPKNVNANPNIALINAINQKRSTI